MLNSQVYLKFEELIFGKLRALILCHMTVRWCSKLIAKHENHNLINQFSQEGAYFWKEMSQNPLKWKLKYQNTTWHGLYQKAMDSDHRWITNHPQYLVFLNHLAITWVKLVKIFVKYLIRKSKQKTSQRVTQDLFWFKWSTQVWHMESSVCTSTTLIGTVAVSASSLCLTHSPQSGSNSTQATVLWGSSSSATSSFTMLLCKPKQPTYLISWCHPQTPCAGNQVAGLKKPQSVIETLLAISAVVGVLSFDFLLSVRLPT